MIKIKNQYRILDIPKVIEKRNRAANTLQDITNNNKQKNFLLMGKSKIKSPLMIRK